jgi:hypothetical protein
VQRVLSWGPAFLVEGFVSHPFRTVRGESGAPGNVILTCLTRSLEGPRRVAHTQAVTIRVWGALLLAVFSQGAGACVTLAAAGSSA